MPNDAKLGLAVGVGLVIAVAVVYYRTESATSTADPAATIIQQEQTDPPPALRNSRRTPTTSTARAESGSKAVLVGSERVNANAEGTLTSGTSVGIPDDERP